MSNKPNEPKLGDRVHDTITGYEGIVVATTQWLTGCARLSVQPETLHDGKVREVEAFDITRLTVLQADVVVPQVSRDTGGPAPSPRQPSTPPQR
jgi:hypothetical protein